MFEKSEAGYAGSYHSIVHIARDANVTECWSIHSQYEQVVSIGRTKALGSRATLNDALI